jgi:hypothetical protein
MTDTALDTGGIHRYLIQSTEGSTHREYFNLTEYDDRAQFNELKFTYGGEDFWGIHFSFPRQIRITLFDGTVAAVGKYFIYDPSHWRSYDAILAPGIGPVMKINTQYDHAAPMIDFDHGTIISSDTFGVLTACHLKTVPVVYEHQWENIGTASKDSVFTIKSAPDSSYEISFRTKENNPDSKFYSVSSFNDGASALRFYIMDTSVIQTPGPGNYSYDHTILVKNVRAVTNARLKIFHVNLIEKRNRMHDSIQTSGLYNEPIAFSTSSMKTYCDINTDKTTVLFGGKNNFSFIVPNTRELSGMKIYTVQGKCVYSQKIMTQKSGNCQVFDLNTLSKQKLSGNYIVQFTYNNNRKLFHKMIAY